MTSTPTKKISLLAIALLITQMTIAVHDIHCLDGEHDETCAVYFTQDHGAQSNSDTHQIKRMLYAEKSGHFTALISPTIFIANYFSRAPPQRF